MRKKTIDQGADSAAPAGQEWLDLEALAGVEFTSESGAHPIESALVPGRGTGWQAAEAGEQTIRVVFDRPQKLRRIFLMFREEERARTQEFVLRWLPAGEKAFREILRQQYNFSPPGATQEAEDYQVELDGVQTFELKIVPDISGGEARAKLAQLRLA